MQKAVKISMLMLISCGGLVQAQERLPLKLVAMQNPVIVGVPVDHRDNHRLTENVHPEALN